jgi:ABC-2 type transport system permease protein
MKALAIAATNLRRLMRDRIGLFFLFVFPLIIIITLGAVFGGGFTAKLGVVSPGDGPLERRLVARLSGIDHVDVIRYEDGAEMLDDVERGAAEGGLVIPADYDLTVRSGGVAALAFIARPAGEGTIALRVSIDSVVSEEAALVRAARFAEQEGAGSFEDGLSAATQVSKEIPSIEATVTFAQGGPADEAAGRYEEGAATQLILFMFLTSVSAAAQLILSRKLGVSRRMISTPTSVRSVLLGEALGRFGVAMVQGLFIVVASALIFDVHWGDPLGVGAVVVLFALVGTGAAMLFGAIFENDQQAAAVGVFLGLSLAALGGCMVPLELFSETMQRVAHLTPHAWAVEGMFELVRRGAGVADIIPQLAVLGGFAVALLTLATWRLQRAIVG